MNAADSPSTSNTHPRLALVGWLGLCFAASLSGIFVSSKGWYDALTKPRMVKLVERGTDSRVCAAHGNLSLGGRVV